MVTVCLNEMVVVKDLSILENILVFFVNVVRPRGHEHISFIFLSAFRDIFSLSFLRIRL